MADLIKREPTAIDLPPKVITNMPSPLHLLFALIFVGLLRVKSWIFG